MEDQELIELADLKIKLLQRINDLLGKSKNHEGNHRKHFSFDKLVSNITKDIRSTENTLQNHEKQKFCKVIRQLTGIKFENINKKWMSDNISKYSAELITSVLKVFIELTVKIEGEKDFEIQDITYHFINLDNCYLLEIEPWVQNICRQKNLSLLTSALSQYSEICKVRTSILEQLKERKYATWKGYTEKDGGIIVFIHSSENTEQHHVYLQIQWSLIFLEKSWQTKHLFDIQPTPKGIDFAKENHDLLRNLCKKSIPTTELIDLLHKVCNAIDLYESKSENDSYEDTKK